MCESHSSFGSFCFQKLQSETDLVPETWVMPINHGYYENVKKRETNQVPRWKKLQKITHRKVIWNWHYIYYCDNLRL